jgi:hypothetical protein
LMSLTASRWGPHRLTVAGTGDNDSVMYAVYHPKSLLPEFIVTYTEA